MKQTPLPSLESVAHYFAVWRQNRESKREPIPESLKAMAISLKNRIPVGQIKAALKVNSKERARNNFPVWHLGFVS